MLLVLGDLGETVTEAVSVILNGNIEIISSLRKIF